MAVFLDVPVGDSVRIGNSTITVEEKSGRRARLRIDTREDVSLERAGAMRRVEPAPPSAQPAPSAPTPPVLTRPVIPAR
jgi:hypothetical protein